MKQFLLQFGGIHSNSVIGGLMVAQCTLGNPGYKGCPPFFFFVAFCSFCSLFSFLLSKSQLLNDIPVAVAGDGTQNPVEKVYSVFAQSHQLIWKK